MKKLISIIKAISFITILLFVVFHLINTYSSIFTIFYEIVDKDNQTLPYLVASGFALSSLLVVFFYEKQKKYIENLIKTLFIILDVFALIIVYNVNIANYVDLLVYIFAIYTGLILLVIGDMAKQYMNKAKTNKDYKKEFEEIEKDFEKLYNQDQEKTKTIVDLEFKKDELEETILTLQNTLIQNKNIQTELTVLQGENEDLQKYIKELESLNNSSLQSDYNNLKEEFERLSKDFNNSIPLAVDKLAMLINMGKDRSLKNEIYQTLWNTYGKKKYTLKNNKFVKT